MSARAIVQDDWERNGVKILVRPSEDKVLHWETPSVVTIDDRERGILPPEDALLRLPDEIARALYEALSRHYGGGGDMTSLRRDYDAERKRVDTFIAHLTQGGAR